GYPYRNDGEEFEYYVERQFVELQNKLHKHFNNINQRLDKMATLAEQLGVEETTLAEVVPELATEITTLQTTLTEKEATLTTDATTLAADSAELAANQAELAAIKVVQEQLAPVVGKAKGLVPAPVVPPPVEPPVEVPVVETPVTTPPVEQPVETPVVPIETPPVS